MTQPSELPQRPLLIGGERLRGNTDRPRTGGGTKYHPFTVEQAAARLLPEAAAVRAAALSIPDRLRGDRVIVEATLMPNYLANSYFPGSLLDFIDASAVGTRYATAPRRTARDPDGSVAEATKSLFIAAGDEALQRLESVLAAPAATVVPRAVREDVQVIERITLPNIQDRLLPAIQADPRQLPVLEAVLHPSGEGRGSRLTPAEGSVLSKWIDLVEGLGGVAETEWIRVSGGLTFVPVRLDPTAQEEAAQFNALRSLHAMPQLRDPGEPLLLPNDPLPAPVVDAVHGGAALRVAVFDGGCADSSPYYAGRVREITAGTIAPTPGTLRHGALVTSALLYGRDIGDPLDPAQMLVDHYQVVPAVGQTGLEMYWLLDIIRDVVEGGDYHVVNLSLGPASPIADDRVDLWTSELDRLAVKHSVLFVIAAGNRGQSPSEELRRVQIPGDMVNGLTVGAADDDSPPRRAPYSNTGPGRAGARVAPAGVAFGGVLPAAPFVGVGSDGRILGDQGTSFAAPLAVHGFADLTARTSLGLATPEVLRAFAVHFTTRCHRDEKVTDVGHGVLPDGYGQALECDSNVAHLLYRGSIARDEYVPLHLPLPDGTPGRVTVRWTLTTTVDTDAADSVEYAKAGLEWVFRPHANKRTFTHPNAKTVVVDVVADSTRAAMLLADGYSPSQEPASETLTPRGRNEAALRQEGKWETVRQAQHRFDPGRLHRPRLDLSHIAREGGALAYGTGDLKYALLVSLFADRGVPLYDQVRAAFPVLVPLTAGVDVSVATA